MRVPAALKHTGVLLEPFTVVQKGITQAYEAQRRLRVWRPRKAAVMGAGTIGLLAALALPARLPALSDLLKLLSHERGFMRGWRAFRHQSPGSFDPFARMRLPRAA